MKSNFRKEDEEDKKIESIARASLISKNKRQIAEQVAQREDMTPDQKMDVAGFLEDDKKIKDRVDRNVGLKPQKKSSGLADQFKDALTYFAPQLVGGLVAQGIEGTDEAFVAGFEQGGNLRDSYLNYKQDVADLALREQGRQFAPRPYQQTDYVTQDGQPALLDPNTGKFMDPNGNVLDAATLKNSITARQENSLKRADERIELSADKFVYQQQKDSQLSDAQTERLSDFQATQQSGAEILRLFNDAETGPIIGRVQSMQQLVDASPDVFNKLQAETANLRLFYQRAMSGLQVNEREMSLISSILPNVNDAPGVFKSKMDVFNRITEKHKEAFLNSIKTGQPLKGQVVQDMINAGQQFEASGATQTSEREQLSIDKQLEIIQKIKSRRK